MDRARVIPSRFAYLGSPSERLALLAFARFRNGDVQATTFYLFIIAVAACEAAVGLALIVGIHRHRRTTDSDRADALRQ